MLRSIGKFGRRTYVVKEVQREVLLVDCFCTPVFNPGFTSFTFGQKPRTSSTSSLCKLQTNPPACPLSNLH
ncbi:hypothetical protein ILYODFUR_013093 [Ilyodon furcidens]|uniref:Uncharacterized protein n=1 Tax=Ilyodon furcidens TaxID=33524 RepID=A0ABV0U527_9TELE